MKKRIIFTILILSLFIFGCSNKTPDLNGIQPPLAPIIADESSAVSTIHLEDELNNPSAHANEKTIIDLKGRTFEYASSGEGGTTYGLKEVVVGWNYNREQTFLLGGKCDYKTTTKGSGTNTFAEIDHGDSGKKDNAALGIYYNRNSYIISYGQHVPVNVKSTWLHPELASGCGDLLPKDGITDHEIAIDVNGKNQAVNKKLVENPEQTIDVGIAISIRRGNWEIILP